MSHANVAHVFHPVFVFVFVFVFVTYELMRHLCGTNRAKLSKLEHRRWE